MSDRQNVAASVKAAGFGEIPDVVEITGNFYRLNSLDAARAEVEAALPEGWRFESLERAGMDVETLGRGIERLEWWEAEARGAFDRRQLGKGPTEIAALRALAEKLREMRT